MAQRWGRGGAWTLVIAAAVLVGCSGRAIDSDVGMDHAPDWVNEGTRALADGDRVFHGVGVAPAMDDASLQRSTADTRARADLAAILGTYVDTVIEDYTATAGEEALAGDEQRIRRQIESVTRINLSGARIIARWRDPESGRLYSLAELDMAHVQNAVTAVDDMDTGVRRHLRERGDNIFDRISEEAD